MRARLLLAALATSIILVLALPATAGSPLHPPVWLLDEDGFAIDEADVQLARFTMTGGSLTIN